MTEKQREIARTATKRYHENIKDIKIRVPKADPDKGIPDYSEIFSKQAQMTGKDSINRYILDLIETDIQNNENGLLQKDFKIAGTARLH